MTTTADTDDTNPRLAALEADVRNINVQLERMHVEQQESRREHAADNRQLNSRMRADQLGNPGQSTPVRSDQTNGKIDQVSSAQRHRPASAPLKQDAGLDQRKIQRQTQD